MRWTKPDFEEITLGGEVTAYVNNDESARHQLRTSEPEAGTAGTVVATGASELAEAISASDQASAGECD